MPPSPDRDRDGDGSGPTAPVPVEPRPDRVLAALLVVIAVLLVVYLGGLALRRAGHDAWNLVPLTDMNQEMSVPTWAAALILAAVAVLLLVVSLSPPEGTTPRRWRFLGAIAALLSADDVAAYHETWVEPVRNRLDTTGFLLQAWVLPGAALVVLVALSQVGFVRALPRATAIGLCLGAAVFLAGALGMEMVSAKLGDQWRTDSVGYELLVAVEEGLELLGATIVVHALLRHLGAHGPSVLVRVRPPEMSSPAPPLRGSAPG